MTMKMHKQRQTPMVPMTTMEEIPVLADDERDELLGLLEDAQTEISSVEAVDYDPKSFKAGLTEIYRSPKR